MRYWSKEDLVGRADANQSKRLRESNNLMVLSVLSGLMGFAGFVFTVVLLFQDRLGRAFICYVASMLCFFIGSVYHGQAIKIYPEGLEGRNET